MDNENIYDDRLGRSTPRAAGTPSRDGEGHQFMVLDTNLNIRRMRTLRWVNTSITQS